MHLQVEHLALEPIQLIKPGVRLESLVGEYRAFVTSLYPIAQGAWCH